MSSTRAWLDSFVSQNALLVATAGGRVATPLAACSPPTFSPQSVVSVGTNPNSVAFEDFNGDGSTDMAVVLNGANAISIRLGDGAGAFGPAIDYAVGVSPQFAVTEDFNRDGKPDLAVANAGSNSISVLLGNGAGGFSTTNSVPAGPVPFGLAVGSFNRSVDLDQNLDLVVTNLQSNTVMILLGDGAGGFGPPASFPVGLAPDFVAVGDFDGDLNLDVA
ncbi:MAG: FG-GAP repeat domain-containing protein, partial [Pyrinomonadaceae bacterium]